MTVVIPEVLIAGPMSYKAIKLKPWFTGDAWAVNIMAQDYPKFRVFILAHNFEGWMAAMLSDTIVNSEKSLSKNTQVEIVVRSYQDESQLDVRGLRDKNHEMFARLRNMVLEYALFPENEEEEQVSEIENFDYMVSVDSDVMVHTDMVSRLVKIMEDDPKIGICSIPVNNMRRRDFNEVYPNAIYNFGHYRVKGKTIEETKFTNKVHKFPLDKLISMDYTGAACIIRLQILRDNPEVRYGPHYNSEDAYFCWQIAKAGYSIKVDTSQVTLHMMDPEIWKKDLKNFSERKIV